MVGETLVKPCLLKTVELLLGEAREENETNISFQQCYLEAQLRYAGRCEKLRDK